MARQSTLSLRHGQAWRRIGGSTLGKVKAIHHLNMETFTRDVMASGSPVHDEDQSDGTESIVTLDE